MWAHLLAKSMQFLLSIRPAVLLMYSSQVKVVSMIEERKNTSRSFPGSWLITGFVTRLTRRMWLVEQDLHTLPEHLSSPPVFSGIRVTRSIVLYILYRKIYTKNRKNTRTCTSLKYMTTTPTRTIIYWNNLNYHLWKSEGWGPWHWKPTELYTKPVLF